MTNRATNSPSSTSFAETNVEKAALVAGIFFLVVGIAGFIPGITTNVGSMTFAGENSNALLLGIFQVSILHNIVHLLYGVVGIAVAGSARASRYYLIGGGVIYLVLWLYGLVISQESTANFVPLNTADDWLHFALGVGMIGVGLLLTQRRGEAAVRHP
jgi:hypothetical protein